MNQKLADSLKELYRVQSQIDQLQEKKSKLRERIARQIIDAKLEGRKFAVGNRQLSYNQRKVTQPITQKYLRETIQEYFNRFGDRSDHRGDPAEHLFEYLLDQRNQSSRYQLDFSAVKKNNRNPNYI